jgi:hypothetical protein
MRWVPFRRILHALTLISQLSLSSNRKYLAFSQDSGVVGVVDIATKMVSKMKTKHDSVCPAKKESL